MDFPQANVISLDGNVTGDLDVTDYASLKERSALLGEINRVRQEELPERKVFLVVINIADTKKYDEIIHVFGYKFADALLSIRLADLEFIHTRQPVFRVGFWSIGLVFYAQDQQDYESTLVRLISVLAKPVICRGIPVSIKAGFGVCDLKKGLGSAEDLLQATYLAGQAGAASPDGWAECNYDLADDHRRSFALISHAGHSLTTPYEFTLSYQARVDLKTGQSNAVEAFLRWHHPTLGLVMPDEFIPLIEMTGLVRELTSWVLTHALAQAAKWHATGYKLKICLKISVKNLDEDDFVDRLSLLLDTHKINPAFLELEFSEKYHFSNISVARDRLRALRDLGVSISIDDFGTGINSLSSLQNIPANVIKIDRRLIKSVIDNPRQQALVRSLIRMAHDLDMQVVAEGLETPAMLEMLVAWRCDYAEGFLINRPMPAEAFMVWYSHRFSKP
ncbi:MAG TPA: GGDEF domain-containing phosphodiesterase [Acidocella sp.]|nr:GGDEF domain-containing phosphodiesterase [Acidocella sp.]